MGSPDNSLSSDSDSVLIAGGGSGPKKSGFRKWGLLERACDARGACRYNLTYSLASSSGDLVTSHS
jgi:hypothetical protein